MIRSRLASWLNRYTFVQYIFVMLPVLLILIYVFSYMQDLMSITKIITYNDSIVEKVYNTGSLKELSIFSENEDGSYVATITGDKSYDVEVTNGNTIFEVYADDVNWYSCMTCNLDVFYQVDCDFIDSIESTDEGLLVTKGDTSVTISKGSRLCTVLLDEDGLYKIDFDEDELEDYTVDNLNMLTVLTKTINGYNLRINSAYSKELDSVEVNFCSNLPSNNLYYDESSQSFIKNISSDFASNFILGSNIITVMFSMLVYVSLLGYLRSKHELSLLEHKEILFVDIFALCVLPLCALATLAIL